MTTDEKSREANKRHREKNRELQRAKRSTPEGRLKEVYLVRACAARKKGLPISPFEEWRDALPPRPDDTDLWKWVLKAIDPAKGLTAGNFRWDKYLRDKVLDNKLGDFNIGCSCSSGKGKTRLSRIAKNEGLETLKELGRSHNALVRQKRADIDHAANVGAFFGYSLRVIAVDLRPRKDGQTTAFYTLRCSACGAVFSRLACRLMGTKGRPKNDVCPHCQAGARRAVSHAKNTGYFEFKEMLKNITVQEDVFRNSHSDYGIRNRDMDFCERCIDADLLGYGDTLREIYAI